MFFSITTFIYLINTVYGIISQHHVDTYFQIIDNKRSVNITQTFKDMTIIKCADACTKAQAIGNCDVASYHKLSMTCHFSVYINSLKTAVDVADVGWVLLRPTERNKYWLRIVLPFYGALKLDTVCFVCNIFV